MICPPSEGPNRPMAVYPSPRRFYDSNKSIGYTIKNKTESKVITHMAGLISLNFKATAFNKVKEINPKARPVLIL